MNDEIKAIDIPCPECYEMIGILTSSLDKRVISLDLNVIDEYNHLFECPHCYEIFKVELVFTRRTYLDSIEKFTIK